MPDVTEEKTKTKSKMDPRIQYENAPSRGLAGIF